jgi:hypothetical protein
MLRKKVEPLAQPPRKGSIINLEYKLHQLSSDFESLGHKDYSRSEWYTRFPLIDVIYDTFIHSQTTPEAMAETLNVMALVSALFASVATNIPMAFGFDELVEQNEILFKNNQSAWSQYYQLSAKESKADVNARILKYYAAGTGFVSSSITQLLSATILSCIVLVLLKSTSFRSPSSTSNKISVDMFKAWYSMIRIPYLCAFCLCVIGSVNMFRAMEFVIGRKFPDYTCKDEMGFTCFYTVPAPSGSVWGRFFSDGVIYVCIFSFVAFCLGSVALQRKRKKFAAITTTMDSLFLSGRPMDLKNFIFCSVLEEKSGDIGISEEDINIAVLGFLQHGMYSKEIIEEEIDFIDWADYEGFPVRIKQRLLRYFNSKKS